MYIFLLSRSGLTRKTVPLEQTWSNLANLVELGICLSGFASFDRVNS